MFRETIESLIDCFFPPHCYCCRRPSGGAGHRLLCAGCLAGLGRTRIKAPLCRLCGRPFAPDVELERATCLSCRIKAPFFLKARALFPYRGPAGAVVKAFKYQDQYHAGPGLLDVAIGKGWFPDAVSASNPVAAVPLHRRQRYRRGYNQAELLAKGVAEHISGPYMPGLLKRVKDTPSQTQLSVHQRIENVKGAFAARRADMPENILLVDDVLTTGATVNECARELKRAGCQSVFVFTLARATP